MCVEKYFYPNFISPSLDSSSMSIHVQLPLILNLSFGRHPDQTPPNDRGFAGKTYQQARLEDVQTTL